MVEGIVCAPAEEFLKTLPTESIDMIITSPPYGTMRKYNGYSFDFESIAFQLFRLIKPGRCIVWVMGDQTIDGCENLMAFKQANYFKQLGLNIETMIYEKKSFLPQNINRYNHVFEYMFVMSKGAIKVFNPVMVDRKFFDSRTTKKMHRSSDGVFKKEGHLLTTPQVKLTNVWKIACAGGQSSKDKEAYQHPAIMPEELAENHILSWSNPGEIILDPLCGSGTSLKMAGLHGRKYLGIDSSQEYCDLAKNRLKKYNLI
jgi:site-specific DNA-methyltransferase (adenine-specific)